MSGPKKFTKEEEQFIQQQLNEKLKQDKERDDVIQTEIRNRYLEEKQKQPGYSGYWD